jgi:hypothetical protein
MLELEIGGRKKGGRGFFFAYCFFSRGGRGIGKAGGARTSRGSIPHAFFALTNGKPPISLSPFLSPPRIRSSSIPCGLASSSADPGFGAVESGGTIDSGNGAGSWSRSDFPRPSSHPLFWWCCCFFFITAWWRQCVVALFSERRRRRDPAGEGRELLHRKICVLCPRRDADANNFRFLFLLWFVRLFLLHSVRADNGDNGLSC